MELAEVGLSKRAIDELLVEAAEAHALAGELAKEGDYWRAVMDLERYAAALEAMTRQ